MTELREFSRLPDDPDYWATLEARIVAGLEPALGDTMDARSPWWSPLARHAWRLSGLAAAAAVAALLFVPRLTATPDLPAAALLRTPAHDPTVVAFIASPEPPTVSALLISSTPNRDD